MEGPLLPSAAHVGYIGTPDRPWKEINADYINAHVELHASVFAYDQVSAVNGQLVVSNATQLAVAITGSTSGVYENYSQTIKVKDPVFTYDTATGKGSLIIAKDRIATGTGIAIYTEYMLVQSNASGPDSDGFYSYTVLRGYGGSTYGTPAPWPKNTALTELGRVNRFGGTSYIDAYWDGGWLHFMGTGTGSPSMRVRERTGTLPTDYLDRVIIGKLDGKTDTVWGALTGYGAVFDGGESGGGVYIRGELGVTGDSRITGNLTVGSPTGPGATIYDGYDKECTLYRTLNVGDSVAHVTGAGRMPASGSFVAGSETITYTGKTLSGGGVGVDYLTGLGSFSTTHYARNRIHLVGATRRHGLEFRSESNIPFFNLFFNETTRQIYWMVAEPGDSQTGTPQKTIIELVKEAGLETLGELPTSNYYHLKVNAGAIVGALLAGRVTVTGELSALSGNFGLIQSAALMVAAQAYNSGQRGGFYAWNLPTTSPYYAMFNPPGHQGLTRGFEFWRYTAADGEKRQGYWDYANGRLVFGTNSAVWADEKGWNITAENTGVAFLSHENALTWWESFGGVSSSWINGACIATTDSEGKIHKSRQANYFVRCEPSSATYGGDDAKFGWYFPFTYGPVTVWSEGLTLSKTGNDITLNGVFLSYISFPNLYYNKTEGRWVISGLYLGTIPTFNDGNYDNSVLSDGAFCPVYDQGLALPGLAFAVSDGVNAARKREFFIDEYNNLFKVRYSDGTVKSVALT